MKEAGNAEEIPKRVCNAISDHCPFGTSTVEADAEGKLWGVCANEVIKCREIGDMLEKK